MTVVHVQRPHRLLTRGSVVPLWLAAFVLSLVFGGVISALAYIPEVPAYGVVIAAAAEAIAVAVFTWAMVSRRTTALVALAQRVDPDDVAEEDLAALRRLPALACAEVDHVQLAILELIVHARAVNSGRGGSVGRPHSPAAASWETAKAADSGLEEPLILHTARGPATPRTGRPGTAYSGFATARSEAPDGFATARSVNEDAGYGSARSARSAMDVGSYNDSAFESCVGSYADDGMPPRPPTRDDRTDSAQATGREMTSAPSPAARAPPAGASGSQSTAVIPAAARSPADPLGDDSLSWLDAMRGAPDGGGPIFFQLMKQLKIGQSLSAVTLPVSILEARSLLEKFSDPFVHADVLAEHDAQRDPYERLLVVVKWFLAAYHIRPEGAKKPYNPVLGEAFCCRFPHATYIAEQVSHHPPVTAIRASGEHFTMQAMYHPQSKLVSPNSAASLGRGNGWIEVGAERQRYTFEWPSAYVSGFLAGSPRIELGGKVTFRSVGSKVSAVAEFVRKGMFSGHYDQVKVDLRGPDGSAAPFSVSGTWHGALQRQDYDEAPRPFLDASTLPMPRPTAVDLEGHELQSRPVWKELTLAIRAGDSDRAAKAKHAVEEAQRAVRKRLAAEGGLHRTKYFRFHTGDEGVARNAKGISGEGDGKEGLWSVAKWTYVGAAQGVPVA